MGQGCVSALVGCGLVRARRGARGSRACTCGVALSWRLTGLEASAGAGSLVASAGEESIFSATGTSATGAAAVSVSEELMAMASVVGSGALRSDSGLAVRISQVRRTFARKTASAFERWAAALDAAGGARAPHARAGCRRHEILAHCFVMGESAL